MAQIPWSEYPRPQLKRSSYMNLNGDWIFSVGVDEHRDREVLFCTVPYPPESALSGLNASLVDDLPYFYYRTFTLPEGFLPEGQRLILHFGAVDQTAHVYVNGHLAGMHEGGYGHFSMDITPYLNKGSGEVLQEILLRVEDHLDRQILPYGKQKHKRGGMWYTPVTGIWQTVWCEAVPEVYITDYSVKTGENSAEVTLFLSDGTTDVQMIPVEEPKYWTPETPYLYTKTLTCGEDTVEIYFAFRTVTVRNVGGIQRLCLNGKPYYFHGVLDQGYYWDGIFTPKEPEQIYKDLRMLKDCGFNMLRKHIKVEPDLFYYACDRLGIAVFQDMVNNGPYGYVRDSVLPTAGIGKTRDDRKMNTDPVKREAFIRSMEETVHQLHYFPCICYWTIFNEGWGQFSGTEMYRKLKSLDPTRPVDTASGWYKGCETDVESEHVYFRKFRAERTQKPLVLSEFGGYTLKTEGHVFNEKKSYGYKTFRSREEWENAFVSLYEEQIIPAVSKGLCASVYTQLSDVEDEINGLVTYDRAVLKVTPERLREMSGKLQEEFRKAVEA